MIQIEQKNVKDKPFFYLTEQVKLKNKYKKIQLYIGKNIPNNLSVYFAKLKEKERELIAEYLNNFDLPKKITTIEFEKLESARLDFKYRFAQLSDFQKEVFWRDFAIKFIFESNAIEGSHLSQKEVEAIIRNKYVSKKLNRKEVVEVENSIKVFELIRSRKFKPNERAIIALHKHLVQGLDIAYGFKKEEIFVNNKPTVAPGKVRESLANLLDWYRKKKKSNSHPLTVAAEFHARFEHIHPFTDGNGRIGRLLFNWMLINSGYGPILFRNKNRRAYFSALDQADDNRPTKLFRHVIDVYRHTITVLTK